MSTDQAVKWVELARRASDETKVVVLWDRSTNRVKVAVSDECICHHVDLEVVRPDALSAVYDQVARAAAALRAHPARGRLRLARAASDTG